MWKITREFLFDNKEEAEMFGHVTRVGCTSPDYDGRELKLKFRMLDDDGTVMYYGLSDDCDSEKAFDPLDDLGQPDAGCTEIQYWDDRCKVWETL